MPTIPFEPEPAEVLKKRVGAALETVVDSIAAASGECLRPGQQRKHVFDFEDGLRVIVSKEKIDHGVVLHTSCSAFSHGSILRNVNHDNLVNVLTKRLQELVGITQSPKQTMITGGGVVHLVFDDPASLN